MGTSTLSTSDGSGVGVGEERSGHEGTFQTRGSAGTR